MNKPLYILSLAAMLALAGCGGKQDKQTAEADHGHGGGIAVTHFTERTELFVEYDPLAKGEESAFAAHLTQLDPAGFRAITEGKLIVSLSGGKLPEEKAEATVSATPGIFRPVLKPQHAGKRRLVLQLVRPEGTVSHDLGEVTVHADRKTAEAALPHEEADSGIAFSKEQQWPIPFALHPVAQREMRASVPATASLRPSPDREAIVAAPGAGLLRPGPNGFPTIGNTVKAGQVVAYFAPRLGGETDAASLKLEAERARLAADQARIERERLEALFKLEAVAEKRLRDALSREKLSQAELNAAEQRLAGLGGGTGGIALKAPVGGRIVAVGAGPGAAVTEGQTLIHIADIDRLWLDARIAESDAPRLSQPSGAMFMTGGTTEPVLLDAGKNARLVAYGGMVDPVTRTVPVVFEFANPEGRLRAGMSVRAEIYSGQLGQTLAVPAGAVVDDNGTPVVYVQLSGERFERRAVTLGARDGGWIAVRGGLKAGERVVSLGAYQLKLAAATPAAIGHGHAH